MKNTKFFLLLFILHLKSPTFLFAKEIGEEKFPRKLAISLNVLPLPVGSLAGFLEWKKFQSASFVLGCNYWFSKKGSLIYNHNDQFYFAITLEYRKYLSASADGFYLAPYLKLRQIIQKDVINYQADANGAFSVERPMQDQNYKQGGIGLIVGYQKVVGGRFVIGGFAGSGYYLVENYTATIDKNWIQKKDRFSRFDLRLGLCLGFAF